MPPFTIDIIEYLTKINYTFEQGQMNIPGRNFSWQPLFGNETNAIVNFTVTDATGAEGKSAQFLAHDSLTNCPQDTQPTTSTPAAGAAAHPSSAPPKCATHSTVRVVSILFCCLTTPTVSFSSVLWQDLTTEPGQVLRILFGRPSTIWKLRSLPALRSYLRTILL